ncbi:hypothetical protein [Streptomyces sp. P9-A2]|uniref:hypothetical protein n=1 Tax=Streptomyces sp. P9-A2 TaxID=3072284 RepID=UPI002FC65541
MTTIVKAASVPLLDRGGSVVTTPLITTPSAGGENRITSGMSVYPVGSMPYARPLARSVKYQVRAARTSSADIRKTAPVFAVVATTPSPSRPPAPGPSPGRTSSRLVRVVVLTGPQLEGIRPWLRRRSIAHTIPERAAQVRNRLSRSSRSLGLFWDFQLHQRVRA